MFLAVRRMELDEIWDVVNAHFEGKNGKILYLDLILPNILVQSRLWMSGGILRRAQPESLAS